MNYNAPGVYIRINMERRTMALYKVKPKQKTSDSNSIKIV